MIRLSTSLMATWSMMQIRLESSSRCFIWFLVRLGYIYIRTSSWRRTHVSYRYLYNSQCTHVRGNIRVLIKLTMPHDLVKHGTPKSFILSTSRLLLLEWRQLRFASSAFATSFTRQWLSTAAKSLEPLTEICRSIKKICYTISARFRCHR